jgi:deazaflavin-dependent oxidoreductase (nitroreductase family)
VQLGEELALVSLIAGDRGSLTVVTTQRYREESMSTSPADFNAQIIDEFRANQGRVGGMFQNMPLLLLHHTGARSGQARVNPVAYYKDGDRYVIYASKAGAPTNPGWYHNLMAHPEARIEVGEDALEVLATEAEGEERERLFQAQVERSAQFGEYQRKTERAIPVVILTPR